MVLSRIVGVRRYVSQSVDKTQDKMVLVQRMDPSIPLFYSERDSSIGEEGR